MVYAIKTRVCAFFIGLVVLKVGVIGGVETQVKTFKAVLDGLTEKQYPDWVTVYTED